MLNLLDTPEHRNRLIRAATAAPSILNTQPWSFRIVADDRIELRADPNLLLAITDSKRREMIISCGAALFNVRMAVRVTGHDPVVWLTPDRDDPDFLASIRFVADEARPPTSGEERLYEAIQRRHTAREPFSQSIGDNMVAELVQAARKESVDARWLSRREAKQLLRRIVTIDNALREDQPYLDELGQWTDAGASPGEGVPADAFGPLPLNRRPPVRDLGLAWPLAGRGQERFEKKPQFVILATETNEVSDWMRTGQALQRLLLTATRYSVTASFLTQLLEDRDRHNKPPRQTWPWPKPWQMIIRLGCTNRTPITPRHGESVKVVDLRAGWLSS